MIDYTIAAIPTIYGGRQYRSRLEAKWAAFFDVLRFSVEYEPADLGRWSPDFLLRGTETTVLVEVKPLTIFDDDTALKMETAARETDYRGALLLLGTAPFHVGGLIALGWYAGVPDLPDARLIWGEAVFGMVDSVRRLGPAVAWASQHETERTVSLSPVVSAAWNVACNMVQWRPGNAGR